MKKLLLAGLAVLCTVGLALAASQVFTPAGIADVQAAYIYNGTGVVTVTNPLPISTQAVGAEYETVAASQTNQAMGATGAIGDYLDHCTIIVATAATAATTILDNATTLYAFANSPGGGIGVYDIPVRVRSVSGAWKITTGAGASVVCTGDFT